ncbi:MAG: hypothetical protein PUB20_02515 [Clostridia bacterium]|nr:hypothetical protein [Clostridia bacterium]
MKKAILNFKSVTPACGICLNGKISPDGDSVLCPKTGIRALDSSCRRFCYDPLKRKPVKIRKPSGFSESDFKL